MLYPLQVTLESSFNLQVAAQIESTIAGETDRSVTLNEFFLQPQDQEYLALDPTSTHMLIDLRL